MAEVILELETAVADANGRKYFPRACGRIMDATGRWEGWIEFVPVEAGTVVRTPRESVQPNRVDLEYWATGLGAAYLEGALERALAPTPAAGPPRSVPAPAYTEPAPAGRHGGARTRPTAVLDPFHVHAQGEDLLRQELRALEAGHLRNIVRAYDLADEAGLDLQALGRAELANLIVEGVRDRAG